jgi:ribosome recycling factor
MLLEQINKDLEISLDQAVKSMIYQLARVRTGRANASLLDNIKFDYYGAPTPLNQLGQVSTPEARLLQIQPFDKQMIGDIEKAILGSNLGVTPSNDGNLIRIPFPLLTEERRKEIAKDVKKIGEDAKIAMRSARRDQNEIVKKAEKAKEISEDESKKFQSEIQNKIDDYVKKVDKAISEKEKEVLSI